MDRENKKKREIKTSPLFFTSMENEISDSRDSFLSLLQLMSFDPD